MISLSQHIASNVVAGLDPKRGVGFQTLAASEKLLGSHDLRVLEEMAPYYHASRADRQTGCLPVREMCYRLPSGDYAVTRIEDWGTDPHGRAGNSLAHSLVVPAQLAKDTRWDPLALLDELVASRPDELPTPGTLHSFELVELPPPVKPELENIDKSWLADLIGGLFSAPPASQRPCLVIAPRVEVRQLLQALVWGLPLEERARLTFATHFYRDCHLHRDRFLLVTIDEWGEAPTEQDSYSVMSWDGVGRNTPLTDFGLGVADELCDGDRRPAPTLRDIIDGIRRGTQSPLPDAFSERDARAVLEATGPRMASTLAGRPELISQLVSTDEPGRGLAEALLRVGGPLKLCGGPADSEIGVRTLEALERAAGRQTWREWSQEWSEELPLGASSGKRPWWAVWQR